MINFETDRTDYVPRQLGLPFGCVNLTSCLGTLVSALVVVGFGGGIFFIIMSAFTSSPVYREAMEAARSDSAVTAALGTPINSGWWIMGSLSEQGLSGDADLAIPISGPRRGGMLYAAARKGNGIWQFYTLAVKLDGDNEVIILQR